MKILSFKDISIGTIFHHPSDPGTLFVKIGEPITDKPYLKDNPEDLPTVTSWYVVKIRSSNDFQIVYGYENVTPDKFDAWMKVECPF